MLIALAAILLIGSVVFGLAVVCALASEIAYQRRRPQLEKRLRRIEAAERVRQRMITIRRLSALFRPRWKTRTV